MSLPLINNKYIYIYIFTQPKIDSEKDFDTYCQLLERLGKDSFCYINQLLHIPQ